MTTLLRHWPEYLIEAAALGLFMIAATVCTVLLEHPASPVHRAVRSGMARRILMGILMGATATALIDSPWGRLSGAHMNPSVTLTFLRLGRIGAADAAFYVAAQFTGALLAVGLVAFVMRAALAHPSVAFAATRPGPSGAAAAFGAEAMMSFVLMLTVLLLSSRPRTASLTGFAAGILIAGFIALEAPVSGMSLNPARTVASALPTGSFRHLWIYFTAPLLGMMAAAEFWLRATRVVVH
jgi:aquaporin Z